MAKKALTKLKTQGEVVAEEQAKDDDFNREWESHAIARAVAARVIAYRANHAITQRALAKLLDLPQPQVSRLESGEYNPSNDTLAKLASRLDMEFSISIAPSKRLPTQITKRTREHASATVETEDAVTRFSAA